jgi:hypothetical protein
MRNLLFILSILFLIASCNKENLHENFKQITISGSVFDSSGRIGMANTPVRILWYGPGIQETPLDTIKTDAQGTIYMQSKLIFQN